MGGGFVLAHGVEVGLCDVVNFCYDVLAESDFCGG